MRVNLDKLQAWDFSRREFLKSSAATAGAFVLGTYVLFLEALVAPFFVTVSQRDHGAS